MSQHHDELERHNSKFNFDFVAEREKFLSQVEAFERTRDKTSLAIQHLDQIRAEIAAAKAERGSLLRQLELMMTEIRSPIIPGNHKYPDQEA